MHIDHLYAVGGFSSWFHHSAAAHLWTNHVTALASVCPICKMGIVVTPISIANNIDGQEGKEEEYSGGRSTFCLITDPNLGYFYLFNAN